MKILCLGEGHRLVFHPWVEGVVRCRECHKNFYQVTIFHWWGP